MQLRKMIRILNEIKKDYGDRLQVTVQVGDFRKQALDYVEIKEVGVSGCHYEDDYGFACVNERSVVSVGLESPSKQTYK